MMSRSFARLALAAGMGFSMAAAVPAQAAITLDQDWSYVQLYAYANTHSGADESSVYLPFTGSYTNGVTAYSTYTYQEYSLDCGCYVDAIDSAFAEATLVASADVTTGLFQASGTYGHGADGWAGAGADVSYGVGLSIDTPYAYTLDLLVAPALVTVMQFDNNVLAGPGFVLNETSLHQTGLLTTGYHSFVAQISHYTNMMGSSSGSFSYTLTLTPVPEPEAYAMMLAGLALVGAAAKRRHS